MQLAAGPGSVTGLNCGALTPVPAVADGSCNPATPSPGGGTPPTGSCNLCSASTVWINEFHYDNDGTDSGEFIEVAGNGGASATGYSIVLYNGANGNTYGSATALPGSFSGAAGETGFVQLQYPPNGIQNGSPDGIALVNTADGCVVEFISYEGTFVAGGGPANACEGTDIGVPETGSAVGTSVGRAGNTADGPWTLFATGATPGTANPAP